MNISNYEEFRRKIQDESGVFSLTQSQLNALEGRERAGRNVRAAIERGLRSVGLRSHPQKLPDRGATPVLIYDPTSTNGKVCIAVLFPSENSAEVIRGAKSGQSATLERIIELASGLKQENGAPRRVDTNGKTPPALRGAGFHTNDIDLNSEHGRKGPNEIELQEFLNQRIIRITNRMASELSLSGNREEKCRQLLDGLRSGGMERTATGYKRVN